MKEDSEQMDVILLILANLTILFGVAFGGLSLFSALFIYWTESAIIGFYNVLKILFHSMPIENIFIRLLSRTASAIFFIIHYGAFMAGHLLFIFLISFFAGHRYGDAFYGFSSEMALSLAALFLSHGYSFIKNFILKEEYKKKTIGDLMGDPYSRIILMHLTLILGVFSSVIIFSVLDFMKIKLWAGGIAEIIVASFFIALKIMFDIKSHKKEHELMGTLLSNQHA